MKSVTIQTIKAELKKLAESIKKTKPEYRSTLSAFDKTKVKKESRYGSIYYEGDEKLGSSAYNLFKELGTAQYEFRHKHIAYCLARGRTMEQIESSGKRCANEKCYCCNKPNMEYVNTFLETYKKGLDDEKKAWEERQKNKEKEDQSEKADTLVRTG